MSLKHFSKISILALNFALLQGSLFAMDNNAKGNSNNVPSTQSANTLLAVNSKTADDKDSSKKDDDPSKNYKLNEINVYGASKRLQKITEAPAAVSVVPKEELDKGTTHGQLVKTLEHYPGIDVVQSGMNDFNVNTRGFNNSINRRVLVLLDGRDPSTPLINLMEWNSLQTNLADVSKIEVVRGPGSALYGANAYNGVINIISNSPREVLGTRASVTGGQYGTLRGDIRHSMKITDDLFFKANIGYSTQDQDWIKSRDITDTVHGGLEYAGLAPDVRGNRQGVGNIQNIDSLINANRKATNVFGTARFDYVLDKENSVLVGEVGYSRYGGEYFVNQTGRILIPDVEKPFARIAYNSNHINVQAHYNRRNTLVPQIVMNAAATSGERSDVYVVDAQWNDSYLDKKLKLVLGASHDYEHVVTAVAGSAPLLSPDDVHHNFSGFYGQLEYELASNLQFIAAARLDRSTLTSTQFSPKAALVWTPIENQTFRLTVNRSFLRPSFADKWRRSPAGAPISTIKGQSLAAIDSTIASNYGVNKLGLSSLSLWNVGNPELDVETAMSYELGYKGVIDKDWYITADLYLNKRTNFISNPNGGLAPSVYTPVRYNNKQADSALSATLGAALYDRLSIDPQTGKIASIVAPANIASTTEYGFELAVNYYLTDELTVNMNYSYLGFNVDDNKVVANKIQPNTSANRINLGAAYSNKTASMPWDVELQARGVDGYKWAAGFYEGYVPGYWVVNFNAAIRPTKEVKLSVNIFNLLDHKHYEIFGGTYLQRYATANLTLNL